MRSLCTPRALGIALGRGRLIQGASPWTPLYFPPPGVEFKKRNAVECLTAPRRVVSSQARLASFSPLWHASCCGACAACGLPGFHFPDSKRLCRARNWGSLALLEAPCRVRPGDPVLGSHRRTTYPGGFPPPGPPCIVLLPVVVAARCPLFVGRGNAVRSGGRVTRARRPGVPGGIRRWGGAGRSAKANGDTLHPRGEGGGNLGRPPGWGSTWRGLGESPGRCQFEEGNRRRSHRAP